jgi:glycosyltransferase involved in cell wall biosynthesis
VSAGRAAFIVPGSLDAPTGGSVYDRHVVDGLRSRGWTIDVHELGGSFPMPEPDAVRAVAAVLESIPDDLPVVADGLAYGALPDLVAAESKRLRFVPIVHLPLALEVELEAGCASRLAESERRALACARAVVVTGRTTIAAVEQLGVPPARVVVVEPGTEPAPLARGSGTSVPHLLCVANLTPGKGHDILIDAAARCADHDWTLTCVGGSSRRPEWAARLAERVRQHHLAGRVALTGVLTGGALAAEYHRADVFVLPTRRETYGMAVADALARGIPIVSTTTGAIPDLVGPDAGVLVAPDDAAAFARALSSVVRDSARRARMSYAAGRVRERLRRWDRAVEEMSVVLEGVASDRG